MFPEKIIITAKGEFKAGLAICLKFGMNQKNDYHYITFVNGEGRVEIGESELLKTFDETRNLFLMDYKDPREHFTGRIEAHVLDKTEIAVAITSIRQIQVTLELSTGLRGQTGNSTHNKS